MVTDCRPNCGIGIRNCDRAVRCILKVLSCAGVSTQEPMLAQKINNGETAIDVLQPGAGIKLRKRSKRKIVTW